MRSRRRGSQQSLRCYLEGCNEDARKLEGIAKIAGYLSDETAPTAAWLNNVKDVMTLLGAVTDVARVSACSVVIWQANPSP